MMTSVPTFCNFVLHFYPYVIFCHTIDGRFHVIFSRILSLYEFVKLILS